MIKLLSSLTEEEWDGRQKAVYALNKAECDLLREKELDTAALEVVNAARFHVANPFLQLSCGSSVWALEEKYFQRDNSHQNRRESIT